MSKKYLIVGASSGIGAACVEKLASEDNILVIVARSEDKLIDLKNKYPGNIHVVPYDLLNIDEYDSIFQVCKEEGIKFDGLVYSAGLDGTWPIKVNNTKQMMDMMTVNCFAFVEIAKRFYSKRFSNDGASIVAISSIAALKFDKGMSSYCASKAALNAYVKIMSKEFAGRGINVNAILPAGVDTPMARKKMEMMSFDNFEGLIPAENIAEQVFYFLSDKAKYISGELMVVGAGMEY